MSVTTNAENRAFFYNNPGSTGEYSLFTINARNGDTFSASVTSNAYNPVMALFFICSENYSTVTLVNSQLAYNNTTTFSFSNEINRILVSAASGSSNRTNLTCSTTQQITDSARYGLASTINERGSASLSASGGSGAAIMIADLQFTF